MRKFLAVVRREYVQRVRSKMFVVATVLGPLMLLLFTVVPAFIAGIRTGGPVRLAIVDESGKVYERLRTSLGSGHAGEEDATVREGPGLVNPGEQDALGGARRMGHAGAQRYEVREINLGGRSAEEVRVELDRLVISGELDAYLVLPHDVLEGGVARYYARNTGDLFTVEQVRATLSRAVREQRMAERGIEPGMMKEITLPVALRTTRVGASGDEEDTGQGFVLVFAVGFVIYLSILMYGQVVLSAVVEEKETRIAEMLFSSIRAFPLMMGKLIGVSLVALTQFAIWGLAFAAFALYGAAALASSGVEVRLPQIAPSAYAYFLLFFLLGYFVYATIYALVGSVVTTAQEGGQLALPIILILVVGFYLAFPVLRSPNSSFAFWVSMVPFFAPITMLVRIVTQTPPFWQIALSLLIGAATVVLNTWLAARVYRVGMLMYGKRASVPEVLRWLRQP